MTESDSVWDHYYNMVRQAIQSGDYPGAETLWFAALQMVEFNGENDPRLFITLDNLAEACYCQNKIPQAKNLYWENVSIKEKYLGKDHVDLANNLKRLAAIYYRQDRFADAAQLGKRILGIYEKEYGQENPEIAEICMNLAILYHRQENFSEARQYFERAQQCKRKGMPAKEIIKPFETKGTTRPAATCDICGRIYVGEVCLKCTLTTMNAFDTGKYRAIQMKAGTAARDE